MAIYFGILSLNSNSIPPEIIDHTNINLPQLEKTYRSPSNKSVIFFKELGIWNYRSQYADNNSLSILAGDPILSDENISFSYDEALQRLAATNTNTSSFLSNCHGTFSGIRFTENNNTIQIFTDKLGVRPIYYTIQDGLFIFCSALWMFEAVNFVNLKPDLDSLAEIAALGYPLSDHTPFDKIKAINPAELIEVSNCQINKTTYYSWNIPNEDNPDISKVRNAIEDAFSLAIQSRLDINCNETAFLSGGMDSRLIVAHLANRDIRANTLNFAPYGSQDLEFGRQAAQALSTNHFELPLGTEEFDDRQVITINNWVRNTPNIKFNKQIWSGDGGSVGLGHVYLNSDIISASKNNLTSETINLLFGFNKWGLPPKTFRRKFQYLHAKILESATTELEKCKNISPLRAPYFFLLLNDQRRHLTKHYERIHIKNFDFKLPFFDPRLINAIIRYPIELFLYHNLYNNILLNLPGKIRTIPWQSYPGHIPCPLLSNNDLNLRYQWDSWHSRSDDRKIEIKNSLECLSIGFKTLFINSPLNSIRLISAGLLTATKIRDQAYYASYARPFYNYLHR